MSAELRSAPPVRLLADCLADAEREVLKLRKLLVVKLCDCRRVSPSLPLEPGQHRLTCTYRRSLDDVPMLLKRQGD